MPETDLAPENRMTKMTRNAIIKERNKDGQKRKNI